MDPSIDTWRTVALPLLRKAGGLDESAAGGSLELRVVRRGARPAGGGEVQLRVPLVRQLPRVVMTDEGMVKRIRGISYSMKVNTARGVGRGRSGMLSPVVKECAGVQTQQGLHHRRNLSQTDGELRSCVFVLCCVRAQQQLRACWIALERQQSNTPPCSCYLVAAARRCRRKTQIAWWMPHVVC